MEFTIDSPLDMHLHLREGAMQERVTPLSAKDFSAAIIMPNLVPPVDNLDRLLAYRTQIESSANGLNFDPLMMLFFRNYTEAELAAAKEHIFGIKLYPAGATTNSEAGVKALDEVEGTFALMEEMGIPLMIHGETHGFVMDREKEFLASYEHLAQKFPKLKITMEHITTKDAVELLDRYENLYATVTLHHLIITLDDVAGGLLNPHLFCKPIAKRPEDQEALLETALKAHPKLMFGSDSAPHPISKKECCGCAAGLFTAPVCLPTLVELFENHGALDNLQNFISDNAQRIHGFTPPKKTVRLAKTGMEVPASYGDVVPYRAGEAIPWTVASVD
ncbi:dihydroorotase [Coraliomargarita akajimensis]|uniref:Dihydroorotase n=1 Tax=Coraliomargarita akajimensis (strain DSM 45221 / IAM 15411 / JCM 23193 / KCTC 12865 / 04OKA010-24) TaxID=583355 RepID=D5EI10_CORAD|nr:dihydroorotase [Coraliomargarita akajimensis]ADE56050.1 dihydroorotase, homodimeric type [Coraliomargarita akajimensis DSM 45221]